MKVKDLEIGMMVKPAGDNEVFHIWSDPLSIDKLPYVRVAINSSRTYAGSSITKDAAVYLGTREDVGFTKEDNAWSNRYILVRGKICPVDPSSWARMKPVI